jgi:hypothetical protein
MLFEKIKIIPLKIDFLNSPVLLFPDAEKFFFDVCFTGLVSTVELFPENLLLF